MRRLRAFWIRFFVLLRRRHLNDEFSAELDAHIAMHTEAGIKAGLEPAEAIYGLMAFSVNRRTREVGIRMALGAERSDVLILILRNASVLVGFGLILGLISAWIVSRLLKSFLFGVSEHDPLTVAAVACLIVVCGLAAAFVPARRAASIDPMQALRTE